MCASGVAQEISREAHEYQNDMPMHENNINEFSKCKPCYKHKQQP